ncbi:hypothetical protein [Brevundimonas sp.]|uniref:hypothetical protein n=1 Tax=Brevundimonas sp. TaxID=1871086 RepID=UPI003F703E53
MSGSGSYLRRHTSAPGAAVLGILAGASVWVASPADAQVIIEATGHVPESCTLTAPGPFTLGDLSDTASRALVVNVNCNTPWTYSLVSANGALVAETPPAQVSGVFTTSLPYVVQTSFATDGAPFGDSGLNSAALTASNAATCVAYASASCPFADSGAAVSIDKSGSLSVSWTTPINPLVAGTYTDTLTLTVLVI